MARRRESGFESFVRVAAKLPWWANAALGLIAFLVFNSMASIEPPKVTGVKEMSGAINASIFRSIGQLLQYLAPLLFGIAAIFSVIGRNRRATLLAETKARGNSSALLDMSWRDFEKLVGEAFRQRGYQVSEMGGSGPDGGVDLVLTKGTEKFLVQCKQWRATMVGVDVVRQLYGVMAARGATGGFVVTSGDFSTDARIFANGRNIELMNAGKLLSIMGKPQPEVTAPDCPSCGSPMVQRVARQGARAGRSFWGCPKYPACRGTRDLS